MKLSNETLAILKNFASISEGIYVAGGSKLRVKDSRSRVLAEAIVAENFPSFCVADLNKFLGILTVDKDVELEFKGPDIVMTMLGGKSKINYRGSPKNLVNAPKDSDFSIDDPFCELTLTKDKLAYIQKILSLLALPDIAIENENDKYVIRVFDPKNDAENSQTLDVEATGRGRNFQIIFDQQTLNFVDGDYDVKLGDNVAEFKHKTLKLTYWIAPELGSNYES